MRPLNYIMVSYRNLAELFLNLFYPKFTPCLISYPTLLNLVVISWNSIPIITMSCTYAHVLPDTHHVPSQYSAPRSTAIRVAYKPKPESFSEQVVRLMSSRPRPRDKVGHNLIPANSSYIHLTNSLRSLSIRPIQTDIAMIMMTPGTPSDSTTFPVNVACRATRSPDSRNASTRPSPHSSLTTASTTSGTLMSARGGCHRPWYSGNPRPSGLLQ